jgi:hypothetical protein
MERDDEGQRAVETGCRGGQGSLRAVAPSGEEKKHKLTSGTSLHKSFTRKSHLLTLISFSCSSLHSRASMYSG